MNPAVEPLTYLTYLSLPEAEKTRLPEPFLTVRWWDHEEVSQLPTQSWFGKLRQDLNAGAKVSINAGVFKYEQAGRAQGATERESFEIIRSVLEKTEVSTVEMLAQRWAEAMGRRVFEPSLVMIDGQLMLPFSLERFERLILSVACDTFGLSVNSQQTRFIPEDVLEACRQPLFDLYNAATGNLDRHRLFDQWARDPANLEQVRLRGRDLVKGYVEGVSQKQVFVGFPATALSYFVDPNGFGARIVGWLEHGRTGMPLVRAIALATVDIVVTPAEGA